MSRTKNGLLEMGSSFGTLGLLMSCMIVALQQTSTTEHT